MAPDAADALERIRSEFEAFGASGADFSALLAAVEAVLALHRRANGWRSVCRTCCNAAGEMVRWPCSTYLAVTRELLSEGESGG